MVHISLQDKYWKICLQWKRKNKKSKKIEDEKIEEKLELEHEQAKEELHQAELAEGYEQDEKFNES